MNKYLKQTEKNNSANMKVQWNDWLPNKYFFTFFILTTKKGNKGKSCEESYSQKSQNMQQIEINMKINMKYMATIHTYTHSHTYLKTLVTGWKKT